jgi:methylated-DNA-[protein]-cysteine S-methyltransferase
LKSIRTAVNQVRKPPAKEFELARYCLNANPRRLHAMPAQTFLVERLDTPTGKILIMTDRGERLRALDWEDCESRLQRLLKVHYSSVTLRRRAGSRSTAAGALRAYFDGDLSATDRLVVATNGTDFQRQVWTALRRIPAGHTMSYGALAANIGHPRAARAVGLANGSNPIAIVVPCHRVIGSDRSLTGFGGGLPRKRWLLEHENVNQIRIPCIA